jgi:hypothetical protein
MIFLSYANLNEFCINLVLSLLQFHKHSLKLYIPYTIRCFTWKCVPLNMCYDRMKSVLNNLLGDLFCFCKFNAPVEAFVITSINKKVCLDAA